MRYKYTGAVRSMAAGRLLFSGAEYELPATDPHVKSLVAQKLLLPAEAAAKPLTEEAQEPKTTKSKTKKSKK